MPDNDTHSEQKCFGMENKMKLTTDYMVGNTAIQIINTGRRIKIVDVEKAKVRRSIMKHLIIALAITGMLITLCFYVVRLENQKVLLNRSVYTLQTQVDKIAKENVLLEKQEQEIPVDYDEIYDRALALGMRFPTNDQIGTYNVEKSTAIRLKKAGAEE